MLPASDGLLHIDSSAIQFVVKISYHLLVNGYSLGWQVWSMRENDELVATPEDR